MTKNYLQPIEEALNRSKALVTKQNEIEKFKAVVNSLSAREYEIFRYVIAGILNKQIAAGIRNCRTHRKKS